MQCSNLTATSETMELHAHFYACRGAALHQCCCDAEADAVADVGADADTVDTLCRLGFAFIHDLCKYIQNDSYWLPYRIKSTSATNYDLFYLVANVRHTTNYTT